MPVAPPVIRTTLPDNISLRNGDFGSGATVSLDKVVVQWHHNGKVFNQAAKYDVPLAEVVTGGHSAVITAERADEPAREALERGAMAAWEAGQRIRDTAELR